MDGYEYEERDGALWEDRRRLLIASAPLLGALHSQLDQPADRFRQIWQIRLTPPPSVDLLYKRHRREQVNLLGMVAQFRRHGLTSIISIMYILSRIFVAHRLRHRRREGLDWGLSPTGAAHEHGETPNDHRNL